MAKSGKFKILYSESEADVMASQAVSLQKAGHEVVTAGDRKGVEQALKQGTFDLVVLGSTLSRNDRHHLPYMVRKSNQSTRILVLHADGGRHPYVDAHMDTGYSVDALVQKIASLAPQQTAAAAAGAGR